MKLLIMGQNPKTPENLKFPFRRTNSGKVLAEWLRRADIPPTAFVLDNAYLTVGEISYARAKITEDAQYGTWNHYIYNYPVIVTLGSVAELVIREALTHTGHKSGYYAHLPHPSGVNRLLNSKDLVEQCVDELRKAYEVLFDRTN